MFHMSRRISAFVTGLVIGSLFATPLTVIAATSPADEISREYPVFQEAPTTASEFNDAVTAMNTGLTASMAIGPQPLPHRDYAAFLSDLWDLLFQTDFTFDTSGLIFDSWIPDGTGILQGQSALGVPFTANILFTLATPQDEDLGLTPEDAAILTTSNASFGVAWIEITTTFGTAKLDGWWMEMDSHDGTQFATFVPISVVDSETWSTLAFALPEILDDIESIWDDTVSPNGRWSTFRNSVRDAVRGAAKTIGFTVVGIVVVAAIVAAIPAMGVAVAITGAVIATTGLFLVVADALDSAAQDINAAVDALRAQINADFPGEYDDATNEEIIRAGKVNYKLH